MSQRHVIRRQIVELTVADAATARRVTPLVSDLISSGVTQLLERLFDSAAGPDETRRIDRLELDLGALDFGTLTEQLPIRIEAALPAALTRAEAITAAATMPERPGGARARRDAAADALLLINQFARTGGVPWWSDSRRRRLIDEAVDQVATSSPAALAQTFRGLIGDDAALRRLIPLLSDASLAAVLAALAPGFGNLPDGLMARLELTPALGVLAPSRRRLIAWRALLRAVLTGAGVALIETALTEIAASLDITLALLLADLRATIRSSPEHDGVATAIVTLAERHPSPPATRAMDAPLAGLVPSSDLAGLLARLAALAGRLPDDGRAAWAAALAAAPSDRLTAAALAALLRPFLRAGLVTLTDLADLLAPLARAEAEAAIPAAPPPAPVADEDSRAVTTAGLCLLWPFLPRFFARLGLLDDRSSAFAAAAQQHRAVLLLHHLATGEIAAPDFALALPKVLCGLPPHAPHYALEPITEVEASEARLLLDAVIAHAGCFGDISPDGLRGSFLIRDGILTTRDGAWLLRVERLTADAVLARLPWTTEWVRQPWMQAAVRVEW